jgi:pimeloyl-ACP methyl ester carboxylesterase
MQMNDAVDRGPPTISGFRSEFISLDGVRLHYWVGGDPDSQPVVLWHGFLATGYVWRLVAPALASAGLAVLIPDMRGYGDSDKPPGTDGYDARSLVEEARTLVARTGFGKGRPLVHAAHDMGALPALIWTADHSSEVKALVYIEAPVMLGNVLRGIIAYTHEAMAQGSMWWWILPLAPGVPERLIVGNERAFLSWFYEGDHVINKAAFTGDVVEEYLRTFSGRDGVLGALGIYRAAFVSIAQTEPLIDAKIETPVLAMGGNKGLGAKVEQMVRLIAKNVEGTVEPTSGHFLPEEAPDVVAHRIIGIARA